LLKAKLRGEICDRIGKTRKSCGRQKKRGIVFCKKETDKESRKEKEGKFGNPIHCRKKGKKGRKICGKREGFAGKTEENLTSVWGGSR